MQHLTTALVLVAAAVPSLADRDWSVVKGQGAPHGISTSNWNSALANPNLTTTYRVNGPDVSSAFPPASDAAWTSAAFDLSVNVAARVHATRNDKRQLQQLSYRIRGRDDDDDDDDDNDDDNNDRNGDYFTGTAIQLNKADEPRGVDNGWKLCVNVFLPKLRRVARSDSQNDNGDCGVFLSSECRQKLLETSSGQFGSCGVAGLPNACKDFIEDDRDEAFGYCEHARFSLSLLTSYREATVTDMRRAQPRTSAPAPRSSPTGPSLTTGTTTTTTATAGRAPSTPSRAA